MTRVHITLKSNNRKVGPIPVSTTEADTCPDACPLKGNGCYADGGSLKLHWDKVSKGERGMDWNAFCDQIADLPAGQLWRHNQAGDLPGKGDQIDTAKLRRLVQANLGKRGFTYTHKPVCMNREGREAIQAANRYGFTINLSANNLAHADELADLGIGPVVTMLPADQMENTTTPAGRKVVVCPAVTHDDVSCATCGLCQRGFFDDLLPGQWKAERCIVGFPAHGSSKRKAETVAKGE